MDFTDMITTCNGYHYLLVIVDRFTGWPEAYPTRSETGQTVVKHLVNHYIPTHGFPRCIRSDNGTHFKNEHLQKVEHMLGLIHKFGSVYHPQSQGCVERMNRTLKEKIAKVMKQTGLNWLQALPLALMATRMSVRSTTGLTPYEQHMGRMYLGPEHNLSPCPTGTVDPVIKGLQYVFPKLLGSQEDLPPKAKADEENRQIPDEEVILRVVKRKWSEPRWLGPFKVTERTSHAVRLQGKGNTWYHISQTSSSQGARQGAD